MIGAIKFARPCEMQTPAPPVAKLKLLGSYGIKNLSNNHHVNASL